MLEIVTVSSLDIRLLACWTTAGKEG
jgi:hypothetical protein